ncbi:MAG: hypothetical protein D6712_20495 [Chloroflexi bacterium]|nr:MAG: hypothetical protein D6712_20495 [Chloroflexota bacterium]
MTTIIMTTIPIHTDIIDSNFLTDRLQQRYIIVACASAINAAGYPQLAAACYGDAVTLPSAHAATEPRFIHYYAAFRYLAYHQPPATDKAVAEIKKIHTHLVPNSKGDL